MRGHRLLTIAAAVLFVGVGCQSAAAATHVFSAPGQHRYAVPPGVASISVVATGAPGQSQPGFPGGLPDTVTGTLPVRPGQGLSVLVGGTAGTVRPGAGGGAPVGGGGASDLRILRTFTTLGELRDRLLVAGGGGGAGDGRHPHLPQADGGPATETGPGRAGIGAESGDSGSVGFGGFGAIVDVHHDDAPRIAGGGGGGFWGGGGGAWQRSEGPNGNGYVGKGGDGSSFVPVGGTVAKAALGVRASVRITENFLPQPDRTKPRLSRLGVSPSAFRPGNYGRAVAARVGGTISYRLSEAARTTFTVERAVIKRRRTVYRRVRGSFTRPGVAGRNRFTFTGRLRGRALPAGRYRLVVVAKDRAGNRSKSGRRAFRIQGDPR